MWRIVLLIAAGCGGGARDGGPEMPSDPPSDPGPEAPTVDPGIPAGTVLDEFLVEPALSDILFVIDDSANMLVYQQNLRQWALARLVPTLTLSNVDFHLGVATTDVATQSPGELQTTSGGLPFVDAATGSPIGAVGDLMFPGQGGSSDERGLEAIYGLLGPAPPDNATGFYREAADLHVVVLSSEDDGSDPARLPTPSFADWLGGLKTDGQTLSFSSFVRFDDGFLGQAYLDVTAALGGETQDIDAANETWGEALDALQDRIFSLPQQRTWPLSAEPDPATIDVVVARDLGGAQPLELVLDRARFDRDGGILSGDWVYDADANTVTSLRFVPDPGDRIRIRYEPR